MHFIVYVRGGGQLIYMSLIQDKLKVYGLQLTVFHSHINDITACVYIVISAVSDQNRFYFLKRGKKVTLMPFPVKSDHRDIQDRTHYDFFTL